mmetsp:Transcript_1615/g.2546  ORF Transcript_1615/g.2546 Transcript_1615/m.2546 type:complete len:107 (-) Transcript_1615:294-614(-)
MTFSAVRIVRSSFGGIESSFFSSQQAENVDPIITYVLKLQKELCVSCEHSYERLRQTFFYFFLWSSGVDAGLPLLEPANRSYDKAKALVLVSVRTRPVPPRLSPAP